MGGRGGTDPGCCTRRLFVALDLPESVRREVNTWRRETLTDPALRHNRGLRIVLLFLGNRPLRDVARYLAAIRGLCATAPAPLIELGGVVSKGARRGRPRLFALPAKSPETEVLQIGLRSVFANQRLTFTNPSSGHSGRTSPSPGCELSRGRRADCSPFTTYPTVRFRQRCGSLSRA